MKVYYDYSYWCLIHKCWISCFQAGKGGELTHDETTIISGALDLTEKVYTQFIHYDVECKPIYYCFTM